MRAVLLLLLLLVVPLVGSSYQMYVLDTILVTFVGALGLNLLTGYAGQISIGHGAFLGVGAFTSALLVTRGGAPFWLSVPAAGCLAALVGVGVGLPSVRIRGLYLAVSTLAAQMLIGWLLSRPALAGGGSVAAPRPELLQADRMYYFALLGVAVLAALFMYNIGRTRLGRAMLAVRDREVAASNIGIEVPRVKLAAFALSAFYAGIAGALLAHLGRSVNFEQFQLDLSIQYLAMIVIGGLGTVRGSLLGATFITLLPIVLRALVAPLENLVPGRTSGILSSLQMVLFGLVIVGFMLLRPRGLASIRIELCSVFLAGGLTWVRRGSSVVSASVRHAVSAARS